MSLLRYICVCVCTHMRPNLIETRRDAIIWERRFPEDVWQKTNCRSAEAGLRSDSTRVQGIAKEDSVADTARERGWRRADHVEPVHHEDFRLY